MEPRLEMVVCGLVAACGLLGAASLGGSQTPESGRARLASLTCGLYDAELANSMEVHLVHHRSQWACGASTRVRRARP